nr:hypothetical protein DM860_012499 [Ipomoea trifida]
MTLTRHVSFKEDSTDRSPAPSSFAGYYSDSESQKKKCQPRCNRCCAWISVGVGVVLAALFIWLIVFYSFLVSNMPRFFLSAVETHSIKIRKDKSGDSTLTANVTVRYNATNDNDKISFDYSQMKASISLDGIHLQWSEVAAFHQTTNNVTKLEMRSVVKNMYVEEADGDDLMSNSQRHLMTVDLTLVGNINYRVGDSRISSCPFKVMCQQAPQTVLDSGVGYGCNIRMSPLRI